MRRSHTSPNSAVPERVVGLARLRLQCQLVMVISLGWWRLMKVTLVRAPLTLSKFASAAPAVPPIGMAYVASSLQKAGHQVAVIDNIGEAIDKYVPYRHNT